MKQCLYKLVYYLVVWCVVGIMRRNFLTLEMEREGKRGVKREERGRKRGVKREERGRERGVKRRRGKGREG